jgi:hypothetical protein
VWVADSSGRGLRKIAESSCDEDAFLVPNLISWGGSPGTILYPKALNDKLTAVKLDLTTMEMSRFLPNPASAYLIQFSPDRDLVAVVLYHEESEIAQVFLGDIPLGLWWQLDTLPCDDEAFEFADPTIYWSADGARFAIPSLKRQSGPHFIHLYDTQSRLATRIEAEPPETGLFWNPDGSALVYTVAAGTGAKNPPGLYRVDIRSRRTVPLLLLEDYHVLSWNPEDDRIYLIHQNDDGNQTDSPALSSCSPAGMDARWLVASQLSGDWGWHASPKGNKLLFITVNSEVRLLHLSSGILNPAMKLN